jgi:hypothetical protein
MGDGRRGNRSVQACASVHRVAVGDASVSGASVNGGVSVIGTRIGGESAIGTGIGGGSAIGIGAGRAIGNGIGGGCDVRDVNGVGSDAGHDDAGDVGRRVGHRVGGGRRSYSAASDPGSGCACCGDHGLDVWKHCSKARGSPCRCLILVRADELALRPIHGPTPATIAGGRVWMPGAGRPGVRRKAALAVGTARSFGENPHGVVASALG